MIRGLLLLLALAGCSDHNIAQPACVFLCFTIITDTEAAPMDYQQLP